MRRRGLDLRGWIAYPSVWFSPVSETVQTYPSAGVCTIDRGQKSPPHGICGTIAAQKTKYLSWSCASSYSFPFPPHKCTPPQSIYKTISAKKPKAPASDRLPPPWISEYTQWMWPTKKDPSWVSLYSFAGVKYKICFAFNVVSSQELLLTL